MKANKARTGNTVRQLRCAMEDTQMWLEHRNSQAPGESLTHFLARQRRNSAAATKAERNPVLAKIERDALALLQVQS